LQRYRVEHPRAVELLSMSSFLMDYPFADRLFPAALEVADHGYVMENGRIVLDGPAEALRQNSDVKEFYLGLNELGSRKNYRDVKRYRRRKRWLA
jgi:hypothetical protein